MASKARCGAADRYRHAASRRCELAEQPYLHALTMGSASPP